MQVRARGDMWGWLALGVALALVGWTAGKSCPDSLGDLAAGTSCTYHWSDLQAVLRPTQIAVGYAWAQQKRDKSFGSSGDAQDEMDDTPIPVVLGQNASGALGLYCLDSHHTLSALDLSGYSKTKVTIAVVCDYRSLDNDALWKTLAGEGFAYLYGRTSVFHRCDGEATSLPTAIPSTCLPPYLIMNPDEQTMLDDPFRSLASFVRKVRNKTACESEAKYCMRGYDRVCNADGHSIPFFEFKWAYFLNAALGGDYWPDPQSYAAFSKLFKPLRFPETNYGSIDVSVYEDMAALLVGLCRGAGAQGYQLPSSFSGGGSLPGWTPAGKPLPSDPSCSAPVCPSRRGEVL